MRRLLLRAAVPRLGGRLGLHRRWRMGASDAGPARSARLRRRGRRWRQRRAAPARRWRTAPARRRRPTRAARHGMEEILIAARRRDRRARPLRAVAGRVPAAVGRGPRRRDHQGDTTGHHTPGPAVRHLLAAAELLLETYQQAHDAAGLRGQRYGLQGGRGAPFDQVLGHLRDAASPSSTSPVPATPRTTGRGSTLAPHPADLLPEPPPSSPLATLRLLTAFLPAPRKPATRWSGPATGRWR